MPTNQDNQLQTLQRKRKEYFVMVNTYIENPSLEQDAQEKKIFKLINDDVLRTLPESNLFRNERIQKIMRRYEWWYLGCCTCGTCGIRRAGTCRASTMSPRPSSSCSCRSTSRSTSTRSTSPPNWKRSLISSWPTSRGIPTTASARSWTASWTTTPVRGRASRNPSSASRR